MRTELAAESGFVLVSLQHVDVPRTPSTANLLKCRRYYVRRTVSAEPLCGSVVCKAALTNNRSIRTHVVARPARRCGGTVRTELAAGSGFVLI